MKTYKRILKENDKYDTKSSVDSRTLEDAYLEILQNYCLNPQTKDEWKIATISVGNNKGKTALSKQTKTTQGGTSTITYLFGEGEGDNRQNVVETYEQGANKEWTLKSRTLAKCTNPKYTLIDGFKPLLTSNMWAKLTDFAKNNLGGIEYVTFNPSLAGAQSKTLGELEKTYGLQVGSIFGPEFKDVKIYVRTAQGKKQGGTASIETLVKKYGLSLDESEGGSSALEYAFPLQDYQFKLPQQALSQNPCVYPTANMPSGLKSEDGKVMNQDAEIMLGTTPNKEFCQAAYDTLMSWKNGTMPQNPALAKLSALKCVKTPDWKGRFDKGLFGKYEKIQNSLTSSREPWGIRGLLDSQGCQATDVMAGETGQQTTFRESTNDNIKKLIRENLLKISNSKKKDLSEETKIVKGRLDVLTEGRNFEDKTKREELFLELIQESVYLHNQGFDEKVISEGIFDMFSGLFGKTGGEGILQTFKEYLVNWMVDKLTPLDPKGWLANIIVTTISSVDIKDLPKLVSNCSFATAKITEGVTEGMIKKLMSDKGVDNTLTGVIRNALFEGMKGTEFVKTIESGISSLVCPGISKISEKLSEKESSMAEKALST